MAHKLKREGVVWQVCERACSIHRPGAENVFLYRGKAILKKKKMLPGWIVP